MIWIKLFWFGIYLMGREGIEPPVATPMFFDACFTDRFEEHDPIS